MHPTANALVTVVVDVPAPPVVTGANITQPALSLTARGHFRLLSARCAVPTYAVLCDSSTAHPRARPTVVVHIHPSYASVRAIALQNV